jgi:hypothetical protein
VALQPGTALFVDGILQAAFQSFPASAELFFHLSCVHTSIMADCYGDIVRFIAERLMGLSFTEQIPFIVTLWNLNGFLGAEDADFDTLAAMDLLIQHACTAAVRTGIVRGVCGFLVNFAFLIQQSPQGYRFLLFYFQDVFMHTITRVMRICQPDITTAMCDVLEQAIMRDWITDPQVAVTWLESICLQLPPHPSYFRLLSLFPGPPTPPIVDFIGQVAPDDENSILLEMFHFLETFACSHPGGFWVCVKPEWVLSFLFADYWAVPGYAIDFIRKVIEMENPDGFIESALKGVIGMFGRYERRVQDAASRLIMELTKVRGIGAEIEGILFEAYPRRCSVTEDWQRCLHGTGGSPVFLKCALAAHVKFNMDAAREEGRTLDSEASAG